MTQIVSYPADSVIIGTVAIFGILLLHTTTKDLKLNNQDGFNLRGFTKICHLAITKVFGQLTD